MSRWGRASNSRSVCSIASRNRTASSPYNVGIAFIAIAIVQIVYSLHYTIEACFTHFLQCKNNTFPSKNKLLLLFNSLFNNIYLFSSTLYVTTDIFCSIYMLVTCFPRQSHMCITFSLFCNFYHTFRALNKVKIVKSARFCILKTSSSRLFYHITCNVLIINMCHKLWMQQPHLRHDS